ncbi:MAG: NTP pyrophosphohydrolases including oxidative damage repair enzymes [uncultured Solirubrobacteraceae bacterium]|uniref:NTP pyrophosphohydrolases including oxidative damage repair enzymes n=1 Tax=uncultured Solirubrobacteraceae bacterium TaxID=1162706 RepID=A0A6J4U1K6_9ACTN|nr:MAG: NTP pyrophosphohydrolases including oxidative damage repair enzymes [uncultured Solirubrobacteraceae bacterium]
MPADPHDLSRFTEAQDAGGTYDRALAELRAGRKTSHWMWFVFPQIAGLGRSPAAQTYAIASLAEAQAYLEHPVLGPRLLECARALTEIHGRSARDVLGETDAMKLRSSMTLFARAAPGEPVFAQVLDRYFGGEGDRATEQRL